MNSGSRTTDYILTTIFFLLLAGILFGTIFSWDFYGIQDSRRLKNKPDLFSLRWDQVPPEIELYFYDHFGFRNTLIRPYKKLMRFCFGRKPRSVTRGENNWLFLSSTIPDYLGYAETSKEDLERWRRVIEGRHAWLAEKGIFYIFVVPPNKHTIYSEYLPKEIALPSGETRLEKLLAYMKENSDVPILDLREAMLAEKKQRQLYFSTDTHWNGFGGFVLYQQLILTMKRFLPELSDPIPFDIDLFEKIPLVGDLILLGGFDKDDYPEENYLLKIDKSSFDRKIENKDDWVVEETIRTGFQGRRIPTRIYNHKNNYHMVIFHDSFLTSANRLFSCNFAQVDILWFRPRYDLLKQAVENYHPDVVIDEIQERALYYLPDDHPEWIAARERQPIKTRERQPIKKSTIKKADK